MNDLVIIQKAYDCYLYLHNTLKSFPKSEKYVLSNDIKKTFFDMLAIFLTANKSQNKKKYLYDADVQLDILRFRIRAAKDLQYLKIKQYEILAGKLNEVGKLLGGWIKSS